MENNNNDEERRKQTAASRNNNNRVPLNQLNQVSSDFSMAISIQQQQTPFPMIESETEDDDEDETFDFNTSSNNYEYFQGEVDDDDEDDFFDEEEEEGEEEYDDDIDVDELTYEDLIALGEFIGEEKRGLSCNEIGRCLKSISSVGGKLGIDKCVVCQVEYEEGEMETVVALLPCKHLYHSDCITKWLQVKKICPICSTEVSSPH